MIKIRSGLLPRGRRTALVALSAALLGAGLASPLTALADPGAARTTATVQVKPGTPKSTGTNATTAGPHLAKPGKAGSARPAPAAQSSTTKTGGKVTPQLADGADPGTGGDDGDGNVANEYDLPVTYKGGQDSAGVVIGPPKVYLVVWGSQWGTPSTNSSGDTVMSADADQAVPYQQDFFKGLGSAGDGWSGVLTQYCEGIASGSVQCPSGAAHIPFPQQGSVLAGVWVDNGAAAPQSATEPQLGDEARAAAQHFGNTTEAQNRNVQYIIDSPQGTDPDKWRELGYCAWHDFQRSSYGQLAYTNMPYLTDVAGCGTNWFGENTARGRLDGYGIIGGHEYAETVTDPNTPGGWTDSTGQEIADKCAWIPYGSNGGLFFENLATGSFPLQTLWSNTDHLCMASDPVYTNPPVVISTMCDRVDAPGSVSIPAVAVDNTGSTVSYSATGLPKGLGINSSTGVISGTAAATSGYQRITVNATDQNGKSASTGFWENISASGTTGCGGIEQLTDGGFENGSADVDHTVMTDAWSPSGYNVITPSSLHAAHSGQWYAWLGQDATSDDSIANSLNTYPGYSSANFSFYLNISTTNTSAASPDTLQLQAIDQYTGQSLGTVKTWTSQNPTNGYQYQSVDLSPFISQVGWGTTIGLRLVSHETGSTPSTAFLVDDASAHES
ncbi:Ig domain-containing protein [Kitasatospora sp. NBC_01287]|uniref:Ig domain-containing protein n=1 Tax=Kitasatospora sp. NBC_01287 TaxID=2903573 RepID=UPI002256645E|nr:Ig domain-containing protein [Kitasatospora sp. NBC_01287]MCX4749362.1 Ig domain-containing protein [Kitasatospora sp. NBC_01287]